MKRIWNFVLLGIISIFIGGICGALYDLTTAEMMIYSLLCWLLLNEFVKITRNYADKKTKQRVKNDK